MNFLFFHVNVAVARYPIIDSGFRRATLRKVVAHHSNWYIIALAWIAKDNQWMWGRALLHKKKSDVFGLNGLGGVGNVHRGVGSGPLVWRRRRCLV